ncbi:hypothetical protein [Streptomyces rimosus]|uniref:hypothetical protein n=1 Tax=Streptomyces rimosus TaxID=1927 RepID=UPI0004C644EA|nr:hypothetical protein [Streptomyces rimosus]
MSRTPDGTRTALLVRTRDMPKGLYRLPVGQPNRHGIVDHFDLRDAVRSGTGLGVIVGRVLVRDQVSGATGVVHHYARLCSIDGENQTVRLGGALADYLWATEDDLVLCGPDLSPVVKAALRALSEGTRAELADGQPAGACTGV